VGAWFHQLLVTDFLAFVKDYELFALFQKLPNRLEADLRPFARHFVTSAIHEREMAGPDSCAAETACFERVRRITCANQHLGSCTDAAEIERSAILG